MAARAFRRLPALQRPTHAMSVAEHLVLVTDLDGTFIGGSASDRTRLYDLIAANRSDITLIYATGRSLAEVVHMQLPTPNFYICDVGTTIYGAEREHCTAVQDWIDGRWCTQRRDTALLTMRGAEGFALQSRPPPAGGEPRRVSYDYAKGMSAEVIEGHRQRIMAAGLDAIFSHGCFLDILPRGVSKGTTMLKLLAHIGRPHAEVVVAGDTLNDLSLFEQAELFPLKRAILVGNADAEITSATGAMQNVYRASAHGAGGILEGLQAVDIKWADA